MAINHLTQAVSTAINCTMLLGFLMDGSKTGYELKKSFSLSFSHFSGLSYGSIYPALKKMEKAGWVTMQVAVQDGSPNRKVYTVTEAGKEAFMAELKAPFEMDRLKNAFLTRLFFFSHLAAEERCAAAERHLASLRQAHENLKAIQPQIEGRADRFQFLCYCFGLRFFEDIARNVSDIVEELKQDKNASANPADLGGGSRKGIPS
ncbi:MAG: PadR family transcriptional regulator [Pseudomonadota bacterium]